MIPAQEELVASDPRVPLCEQTLGELRALAGDLRDVPDPVLAPPVRAWIAEAESQFFECFEGLSDEQIGDVYDEFATLEAEVETALDRLREAGLVFSGWSVDGGLVEVVELAGHPFFLGCQFHPEFTSTPRYGHALFQGFIRAALEYRHQHHPAATA